MTPSIHVLAPCRLHFGMFSFGHAELPQYGGVGVMVSPPAVRVTISSSNHFSMSGALAERAHRTIELLVHHWRLVKPPACRIELDSPRDHIGLGTGTQLGLALARGLRRFLDLAEMPIESLAESAGRGLKSAVGTYGFHYGGLIVDAGKLPGERLGRLAARLEVPDDWRFVLACPREARGLFGDPEADAFARLPRVPPDMTRKLWRIANEQMLPAIARRDCQAFGDAVYHFGLLAGGCFSAVQGAAFIC